MPLKKRKPGLIVRKAEQRLNGMKKIDKNYKSLIDYGGPGIPLTSINVKEQIRICKESNAEYNETLKIADMKSENLKQAESELSDMYTRVLSGCVSKFGSDAVEVTLLGGTRKSERKKMKRKNIKTNNKT